MDVAGVAWVHAVLRACDQGIFEGEIMLYVNDTRHLDLLISKLEKVEGVVKVARFDSATINRHS